jgi:Flp pilus assembly protein TadD
MKRTLAMAAIVFVCLSCTRRVSQGAPPQKRPAAVHQALQRHVDNAFDAGDGDIEARRLRQEMAVNPESLPVRLELAAHYEKQGYADLALEHYRLAAERFPNEPKIVVSMARLLNAQKLNQEAIRVIQRFTATNATPSSDLQAWLGYLYDQAGDHQSAEASHRAAIAASPGVAKLHNNLGYNLLLQSKLEQAVAEFQQALAIDPKMEMARNNLGIALMKNPAAGQQAVDQWVSSGGDRLAARNNAAAALIEQGRYAEARRELEAVLRSTPNYLPALKNLELIASLDGRPAALPAGASTPQSASAGQNSTVVKSLRRFWFAIAGIEQQPATVTRRSGE